MTAVTDGLGHTSTSQYDGLGRMTHTTNAENDTTQMILDVLGNQVGMIDANGIRTSYRYDELNRLFGVVENDTGGAQNVATDRDLFTEYEYNELGSRTTITNARGFTVTLTLFDDLQRPITVTDALGNSQTTVYDALGNVRQFTDRNGELISYEYDLLNRPTAITYHSDGEIVAFEYDALGNRQVMSDSVGVTDYTYDDFYRVTSVNDVYSQTVGYEYDLRGNRTKLIYPDGRSVSYRYDGDGRLFEVEDWNNALTTYEYDMASRLITTKLPMGLRR